MRKYLIFVFIIIMCISCHKYNEDSECGCGTARHITYDNYFGNTYDAYIGYNTTIHPNDWIISATVLNINSFFVWKICNSNLPAIKQITDTIPKLNGIPVRGIHVNVAGTIRDVCPGEDPLLGYQGFLIPETYFGYIIIQLSGVDFRQLWKGFWNFCCL